MPHPDLLQLFLGLSKQRLLNLEIMFIDVQNLQEIVDHPSYKALTSQAHRWQTLNLTGDNWQELNILRGPTAQSFPELTELHMRWFDAGPEEPVLNFSPLPKLRDFGILLYDPVGPDPSIPWHQLTSLQLQGTVNVPSCLAICKKLARLDLFIRNVQPTYPIDSSVSVVHTALERCTLYLTPLDPEINEAETDAIEKILNLLSFPAIDTLDVRRDDIYDGHVAWPSEAMNSFIHRCTALTDLWLDDISISDHEFIAFLLEIPLIEFLCIRELRPTDDDSANLSFPLSSYFIRRLCIDESNSSREHFLPRLKEFSFAINKEFNEAEYVEMVRSRYYYVHEEDGLAISSLEMVYLNLGYEGAPILQAVDAYKLKPLADLQDEGFRFTVSIAGQEIDFDALEGSEFDDSENDKTTGGETDAL
ncbi:hypothetical protein GYMLUDRAFT_957584 [Collybiopsis luxurians FD-317 M1]|nr:hypothetical protein GYMLUDRAFT_957584 [Collybiopsis luxurians FD-317 M1]